MITAAAVAPSTVHSLKCPPLIGPRGAPGGAARARTLAEGTLQLRQSPLQAIPGLGLGLLVLAPFEVAQRRVVGGPRVAHAALELLAGQPLLDGQGGHGRLRQRGHLRSYPCASAEETAMARNDTCSTSGGRQMLVGPCPPTSSNRHSPTPSSSSSTPRRTGRRARRAS